jgi:hypothetical protein
MAIVRPLNQQANEHQFTIHASRVFGSARGVRCCVLACAIEKRSLRSELPCYGHALYERRLRTLIRGGRSSAVERSHATSGFPVYQRQTNADLADVHERSGH